MVIIPKIEYLTQVTYMTEKECNNIITSFRMTFKHKLSLPSTIPNTIMDNRNLYDFRNLYDLQIQAKITNFLVQINAEDILGEVTEIRIKQIQSEMIYTRSIFLDWEENLSPKLYKSHIKYMLALCRKFNISFDVIPSEYNKIQQGDIPIRSIIKQKTFQHSKKYLERKNILYLEQLTSFNNRALLNWKEITERSFMQGTRSNKTPTWFKEIEENSLQNSCKDRNIKPNLVSWNFCAKGNYIPNNKIPMVKDWITIYDASINLPIIGRVNQILLENNEVEIEHWVINDILTTNSVIIVEQHNESCHKDTKITNRNNIGYNKFSINNWLIDKNNACYKTFNIKDCFLIDKKFITGNDNLVYIKRTIDNIFSSAWFIWNINRGLIPHQYIQTSRMNIPDNPLLK